MSDNEKREEGAPPITALNVAPSPHVADPEITTKRVMVDVLVALFPLAAWGVYLFRGLAVLNLATCIVACLGFEWLFTKMRGRKSHLGDFSAVITGVILGLSLPANLCMNIKDVSMVYRIAMAVTVCVIGSGVGIGIGKMVFGGLGFNMFNPAMVGRAFIMISFAGAMGSPGYQAAEGGATSMKVVDGSGKFVDAITQATPLAVTKDFMGQVFEGKVAFASLVDPEKFSILTPYNLFMGMTNGSIGEISALFCLLGGIYLCIRKVASWQIPAGAIFGLAVCGRVAQMLELTPITVIQHLLGGAFLFGAFFIATDPVTSPLSRMGRFIFGVGYGALVMLLRVFSSYPEGVMFAVLIMNAATPLINRFTVPTPVGGAVPQKA